jgi:hypothetical protein
MASLRTAEVAAKLRISVREVLLLIDRGALPRSTDQRGRLVVDESAVDAFASRSSSS